MHKNSAKEITVAEPTFWRRWRFWTLFLSAVAAVIAGCSRQAYRLRADREAYCIVQEKNRDPRWQSKDFNVYPDSRSRFYDPYSPDHPPMPADDPEAHKSMNYIYKMRHYKKWKKDGVINDVQNPCWEALLPSYVTYNGEGKITLDLPTAVALCRLHSTEYQGNLEEIYLAALDVAFERFRFDVQFAGGNDTTFTTQGNLPAARLGATGPGAPASSSILNTASDLSASRRFATGAELLVGIANSFTWQFAGPDTNYATSLINFSLLQPLLRGGGKYLVLEQLTRAERSLLASLRSQAQYRQEFFINVAMGGGTSTNVQRIGGFQGGAGLSGFTGTGQGGFGGVGAGQGFGGVGGRGGVGSSGAGGGAGLAGGGEGSVGGFYGLTQQLQAIRNTETSLAAQIHTLGLLEANLDAGLIDLIQVDEFRQNIETERASLLRAKVNFQDLLETFLISTLNLPSWLPVAVDDSAIRQFQFIDPLVTAEQNRAAVLLDRLGKLPTSPDVQSLGDLRNEAQSLVATASKFVEQIDREFKELASKLTDPKLPRRSDDRDGPAALQRQLESLRKRVASSGEALAEADRAITSNRGDLATNVLVKVCRSVSNELQEMSLIQARARMQRVTFEDIQLTYEDAFLIARENRLDWMNRRAALVDQWRLIPFNANRLKGVANIALDGNMGTYGDNPVNFRGATGSLRARLIFDAPLNRKSERNLYRESLIEYQRAKRNYVSYVDGIALRIRSRLRQIERLRTNAEIQRRALMISIRRVDQTLEDLNKPFAPSQPGQAPQQLGPTLAQNLLRALSDLRNTQDNFMSVWLNYEQARYGLMFDLGVLEVDDNNYLIDQPLDQLLSKYRGMCHDENFEGSPENFVQQVFEMKDLVERPAEHEKKLETVAPLDLAINDPKEWLKADLGLWMTSAESVLHASLNESKVAELELKPLPVEIAQVRTQAEVAAGKSAKAIESTSHKFSETAGAKLAPVPTDGAKAGSAPAKASVEGERRKLIPLLPADVSAKILGKKNGRPMTKEMFLAEMREVKSHRDQGMDSKAIAKAMKLSHEETQAYLTALDRSTLEIVAPAKDPAKSSKLPPTKPKPTPTRGVIQQVTGAQ